MERMPEDYRTVIVLRNLDGLSHEEVASRMGRGVGAVRMLWVRALTRAAPGAGRAGIVRRILMRLYCACSAACSSSVVGRVSRPRRVVSSMRLRYFTLAHSSSWSVWQAAGSRIRKRIGPPCSMPRRPSPSR